MLARYDQGSIVATASRIYAIAPAKKFAEMTGTKLISGRVMPGVFTNPNRDDFVEPEIVLISDTRNERQAVREASKINAPVGRALRHRQLDKVRGPHNTVQQQGKEVTGADLLSPREGIPEGEGAHQGRRRVHYKVSDFEAKVEMTPRG